MADNIKEKIEDKIIDCIVLNARGRLVVFKPENLSKDLIVEKKGDYEKRTISLNIFIKENDFEKEIKELAEKFSSKKEKDFYLVFVDFDVVKQDIGENIWIAPGADFKKIFLLNKKDMSMFLLDKLEEKK